MIDGIPVIDPVAHAYNLAPSNAESGDGEAVPGLLWAMHRNHQPVGVGTTYDELHSDSSVTALAKTLFLESDIELATTHALRRDSDYPFWTADLMSGEGRRKLEARRAGSMRCVPVLPRQWRETDMVGPRLPTSTSGSR